MPALNRQLIMWEVPNLGSKFFIQMYINPQNIQIQSMKDLGEIRTKGGYLLQYWGEKLDEITINGHTGSSGVEGVNVLKDVYRSEQLALLNIIQNAGIDGSKRRQSLAQLAASVVMHYAGVQYFGYFKSFQVTESAESIGIYTYNMVFTVTKTIGLRKNWAGWHRIPRTSMEHPFNSATDDEFAMSNQPGELNRSTNRGSKINFATSAPDGGVLQKAEQLVQQKQSTRSVGSSDNVPNKPADIDPSKYLPPEVIAALGPKRALEEARSRAYSEKILREAQTQLILQQGNQQSF